MSLVNFVKRTYFSYFSKPTGRRSVYRQVQRRAPRSLVFLGLGDLEFVQRLIWFAQQASDEPVSLAGVDMFEMREDSDSLSLKEAHQRLQATQARVKLAPGDPFSALSRNANSWTGTELLVIASCVDSESLERAWFYVPRMLTENALVLRQTGEQEQEAYESIPLAQIEAWGAANSPRRRAA